MSCLLSEIRCDVGFSVPFGRGTQGETYRERESGMSDTAAGCEQTCKRTEHSPALLAIGFDAVTYTEKWRRCCGIVHRLFLPSFAFYEAPILFIDLTRPPKLRAISHPRFLLPIFSNNLQERDEISYFAFTLYNSNVYRIIFTTSWKKVACES